MITASLLIDRVSNSLTRLARSRLISSREIQPLVIRLDRVANTLDPQVNRTTRQANLKDIESQLDQLGYRYSVHPGTGITGTTYFVYKNQKDRHQEQQELRDLAERNGGGFDDPARGSSYRIYITSLEHNK